MKTYSKTLSLQDYKDIPEMNFVTYMKDRLHGTYLPCHEHRSWQYGLCLHALRTHGAKRILEVGGTYSIFAASAAWFGMDVTVVDPDGAGVELFARQNIIQQFQEHRVHLVQKDFMHYWTRKKFDAVVCHSLLEHIEDDHSFFLRLLNFVREGGLLYLTVDFHESGLVVGSHLRSYNQARLNDFIQIAQKYGFDLYGGAADYSFQGEFASLALIRKKTKPTVLLVNHKQKKQCGVFQFGKRIGDLITRSQKCNFIYVEADSLDEFLPYIDIHKPRGIIYNVNLQNLSWLSQEIVNQIRSAGIFQGCIYHEFIMRLFDFYIPMDPDLPDSEVSFNMPRPLFEYENPYPIPTIPTINSFGFGDPHKGFDLVAKKVNDEFDHAILNIHMTYNDFDPNAVEKANKIANACYSNITKKGIQCNITNSFMTDEELLDFLAKGSLNAFFYYDLPGRTISSVIDFALSVKRPIAIRKSYMDRHVLNTNPSICIEDRSLKEILNSGTPPLEPYYKKWNFSKTIEAYERVVESFI